MKVRISYTVDVDDNFRLALRSWYGEEGMATREDVKNWFEAFGDSANDDVIGEYQSKQEGAEMRREDLRAEAEYHAEREKKLRLEGAQPN